MHYHLRKQFKMIRKNAGFPRIFCTAVEIRGLQMVRIMVE